MYHTRDDFKESEHPRGQPNNAGQFAPAPGGSKKTEPEGGKEPPKQEGKSENEPIIPGRIAGRKAQLDGVLALDGYLLQLSKMQKTPEGVKAREKFILDHGMPFTANENTYAGERGTMHLCYENSTKAALNNPDLTYVEGYVLVHGVPVHHAWTVDKTGQIFDPTVDPNEGITGYYGVPFKTDYVLKSAFKNKHYGVLGYQSRKTLEKLLKGEEKDFRAAPDADSLAPAVIADRLSYADSVVRFREPTDKINTPERQQLREKIASDIYNKDIDKRTRNREATLVLGLPGAGKSKFANPLLDGGAIEIDSDIAKSYLPEYEGGKGVFAVHEESSGITRSVLKQALANGDNIVWPRIDSPDKIEKDLKSLKAAGYTVNLRYIDVPEEVALKSAIDRFLKTGRYVSAKVVQDYGDAPKRSYEQAVKTGLLSSHEAYKRGPNGGFERAD